MNDEMLHYYQDELARLQTAGDTFSHAHPDVASSLSLDPRKNADPHMARLIESIAFLNARVSKKLDDTIPRLQQSLLDVIYPHYRKPLPSMAVVQLQVKNDAKPFTINKGTMLETDPSVGQSCQLQTGYDVTVLPLQVNQASTINSDEIRLNLSLVNPDMSFNEVLSSALRFYIDSSDGDSASLVELLLENTVDIEIIAAGKSYRLNKKPLQVGFNEDQSLLPINHESFSGYSLLTEMFCYPDKFRFIDIDASDISVDDGINEIEMVFHLERSRDYSISVSKDCFKLNCVPVINFFKKVLEPVRIDHQQTDYPLMADVRRPNDFVIHHVNRVVKLNENGREQEISPLYGGKNNVDHQQQQAWNVAREGNACWLSIADPNGDWVDQSYTTIIDAVCTNGHLLSAYYQQNPSIALQFTESTGPIKSIVWVLGPSKSNDMTVNQDALYLLNTHLSLNLTELLTPDANKISSLLALYDRNKHHKTLQLGTVIEKIKTESVHQRVYQDGLGALCRGLKTIFYVSTVDVSRGQLWLLMKVLESFLQQYSPTNSFIQIAVIDNANNQEIYQWKAMVGNKSLL